MKVPFQEEIAYGKVFIDKENLLLLAESHMKNE